MKLCLFLLSLCLITFTVNEDPCSYYGEAEDCNSDTTNSCQWTQTETVETGSCKIKGEFSCAGKEGNCVDPCMMINRRCVLNSES